MSTKPVQPTQLFCPGSKHGDTHHLVPHSKARGVNYLACAACGKSEKELREDPSLSLGRAEGAADE